LDWRRGGESNSRI